MTIRIDLPSDEIDAFCKRWQIAELALFGSVLHDSFGRDSDVDVLVSLEKRARHTLFDLSRMEEELEATLGRKVDLVSRRGNRGESEPSASQGNLGVCRNCLWIVTKHIFLISSHRRS